MVLISELITSDIDYSITHVKYTEGPMRFDEWYKLVQEKYPNVTHINCSRNELLTLECANATHIDCSYNYLTTAYFPNATHIDCFMNNLISLNCPNAISINCYRNQLETLICPNARYINCSRNQLINLNCPLATKIYCGHNPIECINAPKLKELHYNSYNAIIPLDLDDPKIYDINYTILNYDILCERQIAQNRQMTKSARH